MEPAKQGRVLSRHNKQANLDFKIQNQKNKEALKHTKKNHKTRTRQNEKIGKFQKESEKSRNKNVIKS